MDKIQKRRFFSLFYFLPPNPLRNQRGLSLLEIIISVGALGFFIILIQSMLVLGHSLTTTQKNLFESFQNARMIKQNICTVNISFKNTNINPAQSYTKKERLCNGKIGDSTLQALQTCEVRKDAGGRTIQDSNGKPDYIRQYTRSYQKLSTINKAKPIIGLYIADIASEPGFKNIVVSKPSSDIRIKNTNIEFKSQDPQYYKVYQDSHTIVRLNMNVSTGAGDFTSGYIFASRCLNHTTGAHSAYNKFSTFHPKAKKKSAMYILETLTKKPFYFPSTKTDTEVIQCCDTNGAEPAGCLSASREWTPRIYVIHLEKAPEGVPPPSQGFALQAGHIQELPEMQDLNTVWGAGFMLSMNKKIQFSQSSFALDTMILKNHCSTSITSIQKCMPLSFGVSPFTQSLVGAGGMKMTGFIKPDVSSCSGYSTGVDTTGIIRL